MHRMIKLVIVALILALVCVPPVVAKEEGEREWQFTVIPYFWLPAMDADSTVNGATVPIDLSFSDILDKFDVFAISGRFEAWKNRKWGLTFDGLYMDLDGDFGGQPLPFLTANSNVVIKQTMLDFAGAYRFLEVPLGVEEAASKGRKPSLLWIDGYGGIRYTELTQEITLNATGTFDPPGPGGPITKTRGTTLGGTEDWVEPFFGGRIWIHVTERFSIGFRGDVGGFGIGSASDLTWNALLGVDYRPWKLASFRLAYRFTGLDYSTGSGSDLFAFDGTMQGPQLGVAFYF